MQRNPLCTFSRFFTVTSLLLLSACSGSSNGWQTPPAQNTTTTPIENQGAAAEQQSLPMAKNVKVALLLPLSGRGSDTGQAMLKAAQLALFDLNAGSSYELIPEDTGNGAQIAMQSAMNKGASLILGPVFSDNTKAVTPMALQNNVNVISFSTDTSAATGNTYLMGFIPQSQVEQVLAYSARRGLNRIAIIAPRDVYGDSVTNSFVTAMQRQRLSNYGIVRYASGQLPTNSDLGVLRAGVNAVLIAAPASDAARVSGALKAYGYPSNSLKRLGTGLWDQPESAKYPDLQGAWYAASSPRQRSGFEQRYFRTYSASPPRLASLAYDATALSIVLARSGQGYTRSSLTNPNGFAGIDGLFRFGQDGLADRSLAILEIQNGSAKVVEDARPRF